MIQRGNDVPDGTAEPEAPSLRERQKSLTRDAILDALAETIVDQGLHDFSVQDVADRAGVSHRTVYRHFPDRDALLDALAEKLDALFRARGLPLLPDSADEIARQVRPAFELFTDHPRLVRAVAVGALGTDRQPRTRQVRDRVFREKVEEAAGELPEGAVRRASAVVRYLASSLAWVVLTDQLGLEDDDATEAVSWAVETLLADLRRRAAGDGEEADPPDGADADDRS